MVKQIIKNAGYESACDYVGLAADVKPTVDVTTGSTFYTLDGGTVWMYCEGNINPITSNGWWEV